MAGTLVVSLDFELFWGMLEVCPLDAYRDNVLGGRKAIPRMLKLFEKYNIHATWATVGFMFAENQEQLQKFFPEIRPTYQKETLDPYRWLPKIDSKDAPCFFAPDLIDLIAKTPGQEIGTHTFSHFYCREAGQTPEQFAADMEAAKAIAKARGIEVKSVVMPRNHCEPEYTEVLRKLGFTAYRDEENDWIHEKIPFFPLVRLLRLVDSYVPLTGQGGYIPKCEDGIWNVVGSRAFKAIKSLPFLEKWKMARIKAQMRHAAKHDLTFHLWWHPHNVGVKTDAHLAQLEELFAYFDTLRTQYGMQSRNMGEIQ